MTHDPRTVLFDAVETLFSLQPVAAALGAPRDRRGHLLRLTAAGQGFALAAAGTYQPFSRIAAVLGAFRKPPAHPDARPAFQLLAGAGVSVCVLTNGAAAATEGLLDAAGLTDPVQRDVGG